METEMEYQTAIDNKVIERLRKLLALSDKDSGATEAEADLALQRANEIMANNNITMAQVESSGGEAEGGRRAKVEQTGEKQSQRRAAYKYQQQIMMALAKANFCYCELKWKYNGRRSLPWGYTIIGRESNVATVQVMFDYLMNTIDRLVLIELDQDHTQRLSRYANSWCLGCSDRLVERIRQRHDEMIAQQKREAEQQRKQYEARAKHPGSAPATGTALIVVLEDVETKERDFNNDVRCGWPLGRTAQNRIEAEAKQKARYDEAIAAGKSKEIAEWYALGYDMERATELGTPKEQKKETEAQRRKRQEKDARWRERYWRRKDREESRIDYAGYSSGKKAGDSIGLDTQIGGSNTAARKLK
jgi:hypothetical protein